MARDFPPLSDIPDGFTASVIPDLVPIMQKSAYSGIGRAGIKAVGSLGARAVAAGLTGLPIALLALTEGLPALAGGLQRASGEGRRRMAGTARGIWEELEASADEEQLLREMTNESNTLASVNAHEIGRLSDRYGRDRGDLSTLLEANRASLGAIQQMSAQEGPTLLEIYAAKGLL